MSPAFPPRGRGGRRFPDIQILVAVFFDVLAVNAGDQADVAVGGLIKIVLQRFFGDIDIEFFEKIDACSQGYVFLNQQRTTGRKMRRRAFMRMGSGCVILLTIHDCSLKVGIFYK